MSWPAILGLGVFVAAALSATVLVDGDSYWHVAVGRWIVQHQSVPTADVFSHSMPRVPWTAYEWGSDVFLYAAHVVGGWRGVQVLAAAAYAFSVAYILRFLLARLEAVYALGLTAMSVALMYTHFLARPHVLAWPLTTVWVGTLVLAVEQRRAPPWPLLALLVAWVNIHGSFLLAGGIAALMAIEALLTTADDPELRMSLAWRWGAFLVASAVAVLLNPRGAHLVGHVLAVTRLDATLAVLNEWKPTSFREPSVFLLWCLLVFGLALVGRIVLRAPRIVLTLGLTYLALKHQRHHAQVGVVAPFLLATPIALGLGAAPRDAHARGALDRAVAALARPMRAGGILAVLLLAAALFAAGRTWIPDRPAARITPDRALDAVRRAGIGSPVFNDYSFGGYLIFQGIPVLIDGRGDMYPTGFVREIHEAVAASSPNSLERVLEKYRIGWTLLPPGAGAVAVLDGMAGWRRLHADSVAIVHVRGDR